MSEKIKKLIGTILCAVSFAILFSPLFAAKSEGAQHSTQLIIRGFNLVEYSPWGCVVIFAPCILTGIMFGNLGNKFKQLFVMIITLLSQIGLSSSSTQAYTWLREASGGFVKIYGFQLLYTFFIIGACVLFYMCCQPNLTEEE